METFWKVQRAREIGKWYNSYYEMRNFDFVPHFTLVNRRLRALSLEWTFYGFSKCLTSPPGSRPAKSFRSNTSRGHREEELINTNLKRTWTLSEPTAWSRNKFFSYFPIFFPTFNKFALSFAQVQILFWVPNIRVRDLLSSGFGSGPALEPAESWEYDPQGPTYTVSSMEECDSVHLLGACSGDGFLPLRPHWGASPSDQTIYV